jgi:flagellar protein FliO/FliZ
MKLVLNLIFLLTMNIAIAATTDTEAVATASERTELSAIAASENVNLETVSVKEAAPAVKTEESKVIAKVDNKKESEIPLNLDAKKSTVGTENTFFKFIMFFAILGTLLTGVWIFLKRNNTKNISRNHNEIKVLAQHYLGPKKSLAVIRVAGESLLVGITDHNVNLIKALSLLDEELPEVTPKDFNKLLTHNENEQMENVKDQFKSSVKTNEKMTKPATYNRSMTKNTKGTNANFSDAKNDMDQEEDEFSIKGIKDIVSSKLKNMRSI